MTCQCRVGRLPPDDCSRDARLETEAAFPTALDYHTFAALAAVGYGGIAPVRPIASSPYTLEAAIGLSSPTVLIGR